MPNFGENAVKSMKICMFPIIKKHGKTHELYRELEQKGLRFVRYADDCVPRSCTRDESLVSRIRCTGIGFKPP